MKTLRKRKWLSNSGGVVARYQLSAAIILGIVIIWGIAAGVYWSKANDTITKNAIASNEADEKLNATLDELANKKKVKEEQEVAKKAKEQAEAEAAAKEAEEVKKRVEVNQGGNGGGQVGCNLSASHNNPASIDVLVNKKHCLMPLSFTPPDLVTTNGATISAKAASDFNRMFSDAAAAGQPFTVTSSYRSYANQVSTYNYWVSVNGQQGADTVSARPGFSEHQTGLAIDVGANGCNIECFAGTSQYQWFQANAANYGFIQRYYAGQEATTGYASEEWHYRYVGVAVAQDMKARNIRTLEAYWGIEGGSYN